MYGMSLNTKLPYLFFFVAYKYTNLTSRVWAHPLMMSAENGQLINPSRAPIVQFEVTPLTLVDSSRYFIVYDNLITC